MARYDKCGKPLMMSSREFPSGCHPCNPTAERGEAKRVLERAESDRSAGSLVYYYREASSV
jgi:hypothetical protein